MRKVLIITYYWPPAGGPGVQRWLKMAKYLPDYGVEPIVLTVKEDKATYPLRDETLLEDVPKNLHVERTETNELFSLYKKTSGRKEVPFSGFANETAKPGPRQVLSKWVRGNILVPDPRKGWNKHALKKAKQLINAEEINTVITTSPPHSTQLIGLKLKKMFPRLTWLADLRDPWTDIYYYDKFYPTKIAKAYDKSLELKVLKNADKVLVVSPHMQRMMANKLPDNSSETIEIVPNGFDSADFENQVLHKRNAPFSIVYTGTITEQYNIDSFLKALKELYKKHSFTMQFVGKRDETLENILKDLPFVKLERTVSHAQAIQFLTKADALFLGIPKIKDNEGIITGKIFEYMAAKKPILGVGPVNGDAADLLNQTGTGKMFDYTDFEGQLHFLQSLIEEEQSFTYAVNSYSRKGIAQEVASLIS